MRLPRSQSPPFNGKRYARQQPLLDVWTTVHSTYYKGYILNTYIPSAVQPTRRACPRYRAPDWFIQRTIPPTKQPFAAHTAREQEKWGDTPRRTIWHSIQDNTQDVCQPSPRKLRRGYREPEHRQHKVWPQCCNVYHKPSDDCSAVERTHLGVRS